MKMQNILFPYNSIFVSDGIKSALMVPYARYFLKNVVPPESSFDFRKFHFLVRSILVKIYIL